MTTIGVVTTSYPRFSGDPAGGFVAEHAAYLAACGFEVEVVAAGDGARPSARGPRPEARGPLQVWRVDGGGLFYRGGAPEAIEGGAWWKAARFTAALGAAVARRARRWDAVVCHWLAPSALVTLAAAPRLPMLAIAHSGDVHLLRRVRALGPLAAALALGRARLSFTTHELRRMALDASPLRGRLREHSQVCPMGVDLRRLSAARAPAAPGERPTVVFLGRLVPVKGAEVLVRAARLWRSAARLVVAGAGPARAEIERLARAAPAGRVELVGEVHGAARDQLLGRADLLVVPSIRLPTGRTEGVPLAALEAMAAGAALVASPLGGLAELPSSVFTAAAPGDAADLAAAVDALVEDPDRRRDQIRAQSEWIAGYDWSVVGPRLLPPGILKQISAPRSALRGSA